MTKSHLALVAPTDRYCDSSRGIGLCHRNIQHAVRYTELAPPRFKNFWHD
jgi:hypothetical protein